MPAGPRLDVASAGFRPAEEHGHWLGIWRVRNDGPSPVTLLAAWQPHGRFRAAERTLSDTPTLEPGDSLELLLPVAFDEPPGTEVENAFVILRVLDGDEPWRVMTRLTARADPESGLSAQVVTISTQRVGFSAEAIP